MARNRDWETYPATYRAKEMKILADWIAAGESGSVVGLIGSGRTNFLGFLCQRQEVLQTYLPSEPEPVVLIPVDIYNLPANDLSSLYRTILHAFYWVRASFEPNLGQTITELYLENRAAQDPFLPQRALYELFRLFQEQQMQIVLVMNRFDRFCQTATPQMINTLRGLRDMFKDTLCYLVGMLQDVAYLPDPAALGDMVELLDSHICWVGAMSEADACFVIDSLSHTAPAPPAETSITAMLTLSGCFPNLLKAIVHWWLQNSDRPAATGDWLEALLLEDNIRYRLERMWNGLTQEEQLALSEVQKLQAQTGQSRPDSGAKNLSKGFINAYQQLTKQQRYALTRLKAKGLCYQEGPAWWIKGELLAAYVARVEGRVRGRIWVDETTKNIYQGQHLIDGLTALQYEILSFLIKNSRIKHTRDDVIDNAWPEGDHREGVTANALQAHIASIRKIIEPNPAQPRYLITWHGRPGGYQFFPEGRPE